jgi:hypothetical protein
MTVFLLTKIGDNGFRQNEKMTKKVLSLGSVICFTGGNNKDDNGS